MSLRGLAVAKQYLAVQPPAFEEAQCHLQAYLLVRDNDPEALRLLGKAKASLGDRTGAIGALERFVVLTLCFF